MPFVILSGSCFVGMYLLYIDEIRSAKIYIKTRNYIDKRKEELTLWVMKNNKPALDQEIFNGSIILKNIAIVRKDSPLSADYIYEKLMENSQMLKVVYGQMLTLYRNNKDGEAFKVLPKVVGTKASKNFAIILSKVERLNPAEFENQMLAFQKSMMEQRMTFALKKVQRNSVILTILTTITIFALLLNFVVVVVFLNTLEMLNNIFV